MTAPQQFPAGWGQQQAPVQGYPQQAPAAPAAPQFPPAAPQYAAPQYAPPAAPAYGPPQGYAPAPGYLGQGYPQQPPAPVAPAVPLEQASSLDDYLNQRPAGIGFWGWKNPGDTCMGMITREVTTADVVQKTYQGVPQRRRDGSPQWNLVLPLVEQDGTEKQWEVSGKDQADLKSAVIAAGGPQNGLPEAGSFVSVQFTHYDHSGKGSARKVKAIQYVRPNGAAPVAPAAPAAPVSNVSIPASGAMVTPQQPVQQFAPPAPAAPPAPQPVQYTQPAPAQAPAPQAAPAPAAQGLSPEAAGQFAALLGGAQQ